MNKHVLPLILALGIASPVGAQPTLASSTPAANAVVSKPDQLALTFTEAVDKKATTVDLTMTSMPGMAMHGGMRMGGYKIAPAADGRGFNIKLKSALATGGYTLAWKTTGKDGSPASGNLRFTVQ